MILVGLFLAFIIQTLARPQEIICDNVRVIRLEAFTNDGCTVTDLKSKSERLMPLSRTYLCWGWSVINSDGSASLYSINNVTCLGKGQGVSWIGFADNIDCKGHSERFILQHGECTRHRPGDTLRWRLADADCCETPVTEDAPKTCDIAAPTPGFGTRERVYYNQRLCALPIPVLPSLPEDINPGASEEYNMTGADIALVVFIVICGVLILGLVGLIVWGMSQTTIVFKDDIQAL